MENKTAMEVEDFLNEVANEVTIKNEKSDDGRHSEDNDRSRHDDHRSSDGRYPNRESNGRRSSRERRRRDGSRTRSNKDADTDEDRDRYRRDRSRDRYRGDRRGGGRDGDFYRGGGRDRSRSPRRDRDRRGRGDRGYRGDRSRERRPDRDDDRRGNGRRRTATPEVTEDDRDKRTIFVQQIAARAETRHLKQFFEAVGPVIEAQIVKDRVTNRSKGVGYVEFKDVESVAKALELTGQKLKGVPIIAQLTEAEKNRASRTTTGENGATANNSGAPFHRLYIGNVHFSISEDDLKGIFEPFGELEQITLQRDDVHGTNRSKGYGFVQFVDPDAAKNALAQMNGFELAGRAIRVGLGNDKFTPESTAHLLRNFPSQQASYQGSAFSGAGGRGAYAGGGGGVYDRSHGKDDRGISGASALDDTDMAGVSFKQVDRNKLMANLARNQVDVPMKEAQPIAKARTIVPDKPMASKCIKIEGAFDPDEELEKYGPNWMKELEVEVKTECDKKYGKVFHLAVDPNSDGEIYVKFDSVAGGEKALQGLNGRTFNYRVIRASYVVEKIYESLYGAASSK